MATLTDRQHNTRLAGMFQILEGGGRGQAACLLSSILAIDNDAASLLATRYRAAGEAGTDASRGRPTRSRGTQLLAKRVSRSVYVPVPSAVSVFWRVALWLGLCVCVW